MMWVVILDIIAGLEVLVGVTHEVFHAFFGFGIIVDWRWRCAVDLSWRHVAFGVFYQVVQKPLPLDDKTVGVLQSWVKRGRNPSKKELYALHQGYLGTASTRDYIGNTKANMPKPLCIWADDGTEHLVGNDDVACFHYHTGCIFLAMQRNTFAQQLGEQTYTAVQLPWEGERFAQPYRIIEQQAETVRSESSPFASDMVLCWFRVAPI